MGLSRGYGEGVTVDSGQPHRGPRVFWLPPGKETTVVLLDDVPVEAIRHQMFLKGDKTAAKMRQTCWGMNPREHADAQPRNCIVCNASLQHPGSVGRKLYLYLSMIDERQFEWNGRQFADMKMLLELDQQGGDLFRSLKKAHGTLQFAHFRVYRTAAPQGKPQTSPRYGDHWQYLGHVGRVNPQTRQLEPTNVNLPPNPTYHFWRSQAIKPLMDASAKRGEPATWEQSVARLIEAIDYNVEIGTYVAKDAAAFVAYLEGKAGQRQGQSGPPPMPPGALPGYAAAPPAGYPTVPAGAVPTVPAGPAAYAPPPAGALPAAAPPPGAYAPPAGPPPVPDPTHGAYPGAPAPAPAAPPAYAPPAGPGGLPYEGVPRAAPPAAPAAPAYPAPTGGAPAYPPAQPGAPAPGYPPAAPTGPAPAPAPQPAGAVPGQPGVPAPPAGGFDFQRGWGAAPPGAPAAAPPAQPGATPDPF